MDYRFFTNCAIWLVCSIVTLNIAWAKTVSNDDLRKVEAQVEQQSAEHQKLQKQADFIGQELDKVNKEMIVTARAIQNSEDKLSKMEKQLELLRHDLEETEKSFVKENDNLIRTLSALQNVATRPTESLLVQPLTPVDIIRSAMMLRVSVPFFEENAKQIRDYFAELNLKKSKVEKQIAEISKQKKSMQNEHSRMKKLALAKASLKSKVEKKSEQARKNMNRLAEQARDLKELLQKIEKERLQRIEKRKLEEKQSADLIKSKQDSITNIASGFARAKGSVPVAARGNIVSQYGDQQNKGVSSKGLTLATRSGAQVISPFDGVVAFAGPFRSYGNMIIIEHDGGYLSLMSGLGSIDTETGQMLLAGEPIGRMPEGEEAKLYVEIRKNNQPINPAAWFKI